MRISLRVTLVTMALWAGAGIFQAGLAGPAPGLPPGTGPVPMPQSSTSIV